MCEPKLITLLNTPYTMLGWEFWAGTDAVIFVKHTVVLRIEKHEYT